MSANIAKLQPMQIAPGVQPNTDKTPLLTPHWTFSDKIRFRNGVPSKIGGYISLPYDYGATIRGVPRSLFSAYVNGMALSTIGTNSNVYSLYGSSLTNITPTSATAISIPNAFYSDYRTLAASPLATTSGSTTITVTDSSASRYAPGNTLNFSVTAAVGGIPAANINGLRVIRSVGVNSYTIIASSAATSAATGGGTVTVSSGYINISVPNMLSNGDRIVLANVISMNGISAATINGQQIIKNVTPTNFDIVTSGFATSMSGLSFSGTGLIQFVGAGGVNLNFTSSQQTSATYQAPLAAGNVNESFGQGYGMGLYGVGLYGTVKISASLRSYPRIWFFDKFGENIVMTPGNQGSLYLWNGIGSGPAIIANAPTAVNYAFVSNNILVTFGAGNIGNHIFASDQANITNWTASSTNQVYENYIYGAGLLKSHVPAMNTNLIFTDNQTYIFSYVGLPFVWQVQPLDLSIGIIAPMARCQVRGVAYWMGQQNFYMWAGGTIQIMASNSQVTSTILNYVFENLTSSQRSKIFCWYNRQFDEIWWHYPSQASNEPDRVARYSVSEQTWCPDTFTRTAAEYPDNNYVLPRLMDSGGTLYAHESGNDANGSSMPFVLTSNYRTNGRNNALISSFIPDSEQTGNVAVTISTYRYPQSSSSVTSGTYTVTPSTEWVETQLGGRFWQYNVIGNQLGQAWMAGQWMELIQDSSSQ